MPMYTVKADFLEYLKVKLPDLQCEHNSSFPLRLDKKAVSSRVEQEVSFVHISHGG